MDLAGLVDQGFGPHQLRIHAGNVEDFVAATGDDADRWRAAAPPGYLATALFVVAPSLLDQVSDRSVVHGEQTFVWHRSLAMGSQLDISGTVTKVRERGGVAFVGFDLDVSDAIGPVAGGSSLFLVSGESPPGTGGDVRPEPSPHDHGDPGPGELSASRADLIRYAAATRDWNPVHWDHDSAVSAGLPGIVVHGLLQAGWVFASVSRLRSGDRPLGSARVRFRNPIFPAVPVRVTFEENEGVVAASLTGDDREHLSARIELAPE
jgi:acyl dehydratase